MEIDLGNGLIVVIDDDDWEKVKGFEWRAFKSKNGHYAVARVFLHKLVMKAGADQKIDHIDLDKLNCRKKNLRPATHQQNCWNTGPIDRTNRSHPYKGVSLDRTHGRYKAQIKHDGVRHSLGYFASAEDAARAYNEAAKRLRGEWAYLNPLPETAT